MNRAYKVSQFEEIVKMFRDSFNCQVWTDVIVGYPTEKEEDFSKTLEFIRKIRPDWINVSKFGIRPGTEAAKLKPLPTDIVKERSRIASELVRKISLEKNQEWIGWEGEILVSEKGNQPNQWIGRNFAYKPVLVESRNNPFGKIVRVKITEVSHSHLSGKLLT
jgi:tRNA A37 methylthiotransferase MiaB